MGLGDYAPLRSLGLGPAILLHNGRNLLHEFGTCAQIRRLLRRIGERIPHTSVDLRVGHLRSFIISMNRAFAIAMSRCDVRGVFFWNACSTNTALASLAV
jgi:hypothetical protein